MGQARAGYPAADDDQVENLSGKRFRCSFHRRLKTSRILLQSWDYSRPGPDIKARPATA